MSTEAEISRQHAGVLYLVEMHFSTGVQRVTNWTHNLDWMGHQWIGLGALVSVSQIEDSEALAYPAMELGLNITNAAQLALALASPSTYRGRDVVIYHGLLDDELRVLGEPDVAWAGAMDQVRVKTGNGDDDQGAVAMRCEIPGRDSRGVTSLRLNDAQHQARFPGDTGLSRVEALTGKPVTWLSVKFQRV